MTNLRTLLNAFTAPLLKLTAISLTTQLRRVLRIVYAERTSPRERSLGAEGDSPCPIDLRLDTR